MYSQISWFVFWTEIYQEYSNKVLTMTYWILFKLLSVKLLFKSSLFELLITEILVYSGSWVFSPHGKLFRTNYRY